MNETPRGFTFAACPLGANVEVLPGGIVSPDGLLGLSFIVLQIDRYQSQTGFSLGLILVVGLHILDDQSAVNPLGTNQPKKSWQPCR